MILYVDTETRKLRRSVADSREVNSLQFKRGDSAEIQLVFVSANTQVELADGSVITFGIKSDGIFDGEFLVSTSDFTKSGSGATAVYTGNPSFNTTALNTALGVDLATNNDIARLKVGVEISWEDGVSGAITSTETIAGYVHNDVIKGDEGTPSAQPSPEDWLAARAPVYPDSNPDFKVSFNVGNLTADREPWMPDYAGQFVLAELSGGFAPGGAPASAGLVWIKTDGRHWFSTGTASSANWVETVTAAGLVANSTLRSAVRAALIDSYVDRPTAEAALVDPGAVFFNNTLGILEGTRKADVVFESGTTRTLTVADNGRVIICTNAAGCTITMPAGGLGDGFNCGIISPVHDSTLSIGTGGVANGESGTKTATIAQGYQACSLLYHGSIDWIVTGNVGAFA